MALVCEERDVYVYTYSVVLGGTGMKEDTWNTYT